METYQKQRNFVSGLWAQYSNNVNKDFKNNYSPLLELVSKEVAEGFENGRLNLIEILSAVAKEIPVKPNTRAEWAVWKFWNEFSAMAYAAIASTTGLDCFFTEQHYREILPKRPEFLSDQIDYSLPADKLLAAILEKVL